MIIECQELHTYVVVQNVITYDANDAKFEDAHMMTKIRKITNKKIYQLSSGKKKQTT